MKAILRSTIIGLVLLGGYAGFTASANAYATHLPMPLPMPPQK